SGEPTGTWPRAGQTRRAPRDPSGQAGRASGRRERNSGTQSRPPGGTTRARSLGDTAWTRSPGDAARPGERESGAAVWLKGRSGPVEQQRGASRQRIRPFEEGPQEALTFLLAPEMPEAGGSPLPSLR